MMATYDTESIKLNPNVTILQAEAKAICEAALWFKLNRMESENYICIFTDSQATLQALHNPHFTSKLIDRRHNNTTKPAKENS